MKVKQTAGREALGEFAPKFAALNDDVLFGEVWSGDTLPLKTRSMLTVTTLVAKGLIDSSFQYHLQTAKQNGVTKKRNGGASNSRRFLCGLAELVGGVPYGKGSL